jgi:hypothetical protein
MARFDTCQSLARFRSQGKPDPEAEIAHIQSFKIRFEHLAAAFRLPANHLGAPGACGHAVVLVE